MKHITKTAIEAIAMDLRFEYEYWSEAIRAHEALGNQEFIVSSKAAKHAVNALIYALASRLALLDKGFQRDKFLKQCGIK